MVPLRSPVSRWAETPLAADLRVGALLRALTRRRRHRALL